MGGGESYKYYCKKREEKVCVKCTWVRIDINDWINGEKETNLSYRISNKICKFYSSRRWCLTLSLEDGLELVINIRKKKVWKEKNSNFTLENPGQYYLNHMIKVNFRGVMWMLGTLMGWDEHIIFVVFFPKTHNSKSNHEIT